MEVSFSLIHHIFSSLVPPAPGYMQGGKELCPKSQEKLAEVQ